MPKKIKIGASVVLDLKAELELAQKKSKDNTHSLSTIIANSKAKLEPGNKGVVDRNSKDISQQEAGKNTSSEKNWKLAKKSLVHKSKIYQKMLDMGIDHDKNKSLDPELAKYVNESSIDFEAKAISEFLNKSEPENKFKNYISASKHQTAQLDPWVEIVDEFGRTRLVKKSQMLETAEKSSLFSSDMKTEIKRKEWEAETLSNPSKNTHFDDRNEIRNKAAGFYRLSQDEETREIQLKELNKLRQQTIEKQKSKIPISERREKLLELQREKLLARKRKIAERDAKEKDFEISPRLNDQINKLFHDLE